MIVELPKFISINNPLNQYIYELLDPINMECRYVGKTKNLKRRYNSHLNQSKKRKTHKECWIYNLLSKDMKPIMRVIAITNLDYINETEILEIAKRNNLTNATKGGDGQSNILGSTISKIKITRCKNKKWNCKKKKNKSVVGYNIKTGEIITFKGAKKAADVMGFNQAHITSCCVKRKSFKTHKGYVWRYIGEENGI